MLSYRLNAYRTDLILGDLRNGVQGGVSQGVRGGLCKVEGDKDDALEQLSPRAP